ncbi:MAG: hypothetical protein HY699_09820 [Deltaproteobacteria bacterium]|nr:hypothetical protein [Deltaproteobacteria bacterium]
MAGESPLKVRAIVSRALPRELTLRLVPGRGTPAPAKGVEVALSLGAASAQRLRLVRWQPAGLALGGLWPAEPDQLAQELLTTLDTREQQVLRLRFGIGEPREHSLSEVGRRLAVTGERIRQIEANALRKLRHPNHRQHESGPAVGDRDGRAHSSGWSEPPAHNR